MTGQPQLRSTIPSESRRALQRAHLVFASLYSTTCKMACLVRDEDFLKRVEHMANVVCAEALQENWLYLADDDD